MGYRNDHVDWFSIGGFGDGYGSFFGVYVDFVSYLILRKVCFIFIRKEMVLGLGFKL